MKKWFLFFMTCILIVSIGTAYLFYGAITAPQEDEQQRAISLVTADGEIQEIIDIEHYHGVESYQVVVAKNVDEQEVIYWVRDDLEKVVTRKAADGWSKERVLEFVSEELQPKKLKEIRLGIERGKPVYEISYIDDDSRYSYYYISFKDGTFIKRYSLRQT